MSEAITIEVLNTGSELLLGDVVNTHLTGLASRFLPMGLRVSRQTTVPDGAPIREAIAECLGRCDVLIVTGGLGPTTDDVTREVTAELLGLPMSEDLSVTQAITERLERRGYVFQERMRRQAMVPRNARVLSNPHGTAPGLYFPPLESAWRNTPHIFLLPGPPRELFPMVDADLLPLLASIAGQTTVRERRLYHVVGMGESAVEAEIGLALSQRGDIEVGYCARSNEVDLRLIAPQAILDEVEPLVLAAVGKHLVSKTGERLEAWVVAELIRQGRTVTTAESCTGGLLAHRITNISGASEVFPLGFVTYSNDAKAAELGVAPQLIETHGAVSAEVATAMAEGALARAKTHFALSLTGIAGPSGGSEEKPVGTIFLGFAEQGKPSTAHREFFPTDRETFKQLASQKALDLLRHALLEVNG
ncbi:MAG: CinA family nicotinamide mononucleotide deamidase-related protein [Terrimicrobiaceae bacterium]